MSYEQILFEVQDGVALITFNRPEQMNTWTAIMASEMSDAMLRCNEMMKKETGVFAWLGNQRDAREGVMSFIEKRSPSWTLNPGDVPDDLFD